jgi:hypothetical protein
MALSGAGFGLFQSPNNRTMIAAAPRERSDGASGMPGTERLLGHTIGAALVASRRSVCGKANAPPASDTYGIIYGPTR